MQVKYLLGECTPGERLQVESWLNESEANQKAFEQVKTLWDSSREISRESKVDSDEAWERFRQLRTMGDRGGLPARVAPVFALPGRMMGIAASVVVLLSLGLLLNRFFRENKTTPVQVAMVNLQSVEGILKDTLSDGTVVTLNKNSRLSFPAAFNDTVRRVAMEGEVFFEVAKNAAKPFVIQTPEVVVRVLGTSFQVKSRRGSSRVIVETGLVSVTHKGRQVKLQPGNRVTVQATDTALVVEKTSGTLYRYFVNHEFRCDNTPLSDLAAALEEAFGKKIIIENQSVANLRITTTFSDESLETILDIIEQTLGVKAINTGGAILLQ